MNPGPLVQLFPMLLIFGVMYFVMIRPQMKQQKELAQMQSKLKKNDEVVTNGGLHGTVVNLKDSVVTLRIDDNVRMDVDRNCVGRLVKEG
ncbi:MAG: preprotein translocase subunit YajC [Candidatus Omnitrophota bacterium]|nr:preprotein translocase subunit YajC [Candidatus Omnitrophota bacterium]